MNSYIFYLSLLFVMAFFPHLEGGSMIGNSKKSIHMDLSYKEIKIFSKKMNKEKNLCLQGIGGSFYGGVIRKFNFAFGSNEKLNIDQSRALFLEVANEFIERISINPELMKYMLDNKIDVRNIDFMLNFFDENLDEFIDNEIISGVFNMENIIYYYVWDNEAKSLKKVAEESYEEAQKKYQFQKQNSLNESRLSN